MLRIQFYSSPFLNESLSELIERITKVLQVKLVVDISCPEEDEDLMDAWKSGLLDTLREDCESLLKVFKREEFGRGELCIDEDEAENILRSCSAVRLKIRETFLNRINDEVLESADIDFHNLSPDEQKTFACYAFLANLQELLIRELDA